MKIFKKIDSIIKKWLRQWLVNPISFQDMPYQTKTTAFIDIHSNIDLNRLKDLPDDIVEIKLINHMIPEIKKYIDFSEITMCDNNRYKHAVLRVGYVKE